LQNSLHNWKIFYVFAIIFYIEGIHGLKLCEVKSMFEPGYVALASSGTCDYPHLLSSRIGVGRGKPQKKVFVPSWASVNEDPSIKLWGLGLQNNLVKSLKKCSSQLKQW
jgi:hypothetical protein